MQQRGGVATAFWRGNILHVSNMYLMVHQPRSEAEKMYSNSPSDWQVGTAHALACARHPIGPSAHGEQAGERHGGTELPMNCLGGSGPVVN